MKYCFRVDATQNIGTGHLMRCLTLADELVGKRVSVFFVCSYLPEEIHQVVLKKGYKVYSLTSAEDPSTPDGQVNQHSQWLKVGWETDAGQTKAVLKKEETEMEIDWLIVDHYTLDWRWETKMREVVKNIMVIDDLADRRHDCDLLLNQNPYENMDSRYESLLSRDCIKLLGSEYALLRPGFRELRKGLRVRDGNINRILIFFGGVDMTNETAKALETIRLLHRPDITVDVVVGSSNPHKKQIKKLCETNANITYHCQVDNMAQLLFDADLAIGAGGSATWERCCLGLPSLVTILSENQYELTLSAEEFGVVVNMGWGHKLTPEHYLKAIDNLSSHDLVRMSLNGLKLVDGEGCTRVAQKVISMSEH